MNSSTPRSLIIVGAGGHAREVAWLASEADVPWRVLGFLDDDPALRGGEVCGFPILGDIDSWTSHPDAWLIVAIGSPRTRRAIVERLESRRKAPFATLVHRGVVKSPYVSLGEGTMVAAGCVLTTQVTVGRHVLLNIGCTVSHDSVLDDYATVAPNVAIPGNVRLQSGVELGMGCSLRQGLTIGRGAMGAMGAVITKDVEPSAVVMGCPARPMRQLAPF